MNSKYDDFDSLEFYTPMRSKRKMSRPAPIKRVTDGICHFQGKLKYSSRKTAHIMLKELTKKEGRSEARAYKCPHCEAYHLTSKTVNYDLTERLEKTVHDIFNRNFDTVEYSVERVSKTSRIANSK